MSPDATPNAARLRRLPSARNFWPIVALAVMLLYNVLFTKNFGRVQVKRPTDSQRPVVVLAACDATLHGAAARHDAHEGEDYIGHWANPADWVAWDVEIAEAGDLKVEADFACPDGSGGGQYAVAIAGQQVSATVQETGSGADFTTVELGIITIEEAGRYTLSVRPLAIQAQGVMHLRTIALRPVGQPRLYGSMVDILHRGSIVMLLATGMTLVIATGGIDLSVGAVMAMAGAVAALVLTRTGYPVGSVVVVALVVACAAGLWNGLLVAFLRLQPIVATLILLVAGRGVAQLLTDGQIITFERPAFEFIGRGSALYLPITVFIVVGVVALTLLVTRTTVAGLYIEAVGNNERASRLCGIRPGLVKMLVYGFSGLCAGIAGLIYTADIQAADINNCGLYLELDAILAVVIGGTPFSGGRANVLGSILGALIMQTLTTMIFTRGLGVEYTLVVKAAVVIAVCLLQSPEFRARVLRVRRGRAAP